MKKSQLIIKLKKYENRFENIKKFANRKSLHNQPTAQLVGIHLLIIHLRNAWDGANKFSISCIYHVWLEIHTLIKHGNCTNNTSVILKIDFMMY